MDRLPANRQIGGDGDADISSFFDVIADLLDDNDVDPVFVYLDGVEFADGFGLVMAGNLIGYRVLTSVAAHSADVTGVSLVCCFHQGRGFLNRPF